MREARVDALARGDDSQARPTPARRASRAGGGPRARRRRAGCRDRRVEREELEQVGGGRAQAAGAGEVGEVPGRRRAAEARVALDEAGRVERGVREAERRGDALADELAVGRARALRERVAEQAHAVVGVDGAAAGRALRLAWPGSRRAGRAARTGPCARACRPRAAARGSRGRPDVCVARSSSVIARPTTGGATGRCAATGSSNATRPSRAMSASSAPVNVLVIEPISNTESARHAAAPEAGLTARAHADGDPLKARPHSSPSQPPA